VSERRGRSSADQSTATAPPNKSLTDYFTGWHNYIYQRGRLSQFRRAPTHTKFNRFPSSLDTPGWMSQVTGSDNTGTGGTPPVQIEPLITDYVSGCLAGGLSHVVQIATANVNELAAPLTDETTFHSKARSQVTLGVAAG